MPTHVFESMGTVVSVHTEQRLPSSAVLSRVERAFAELDEQYSLYKPASELSRIASGALRLEAASADLLEVYALAIDWRSRTDGAFTPHRPDGIIDLSGVVKALAIEGALCELELAGANDCIVNAGGDVAVGPAVRSSPWIVGIVDPADRTALLTSLALTGSRRACATSGSAERGDHIWSTQSTVEFVQATVVADDIVTADILATAIVAGGSETLERACRDWSIDVVTVDRQAGIRMTPGAVEAMHAAAAVANP